MAVSLYVLLVLASGLFSNSKIILYVQPPGSSYCPDSERNCCHSLNYYAQKNDWVPQTNVFFLPGTHLLAANASIMVNNISDMIISTVNCSYFATIKCLNNSGFVFHNVKNIRIECLVFTNCAKYAPVGECYNLHVALLFGSSTNVSLFNVTVKKSIGYGICGQDNDGYFESDRVILEENIGTLSLHGGNMQHFYHECSAGSTSLVITSSYFLHGLNSRPFSTSSGLSVVLMCSTSAIEISISECTFQNNSSPLKSGSGGHIFMFLTSLSNQINLENSSFDGGIASRGGAIFVSISPKSINIDSNGKFISVNNCTFSNNKAGYSGGAVHLSYHEYALDKNYCCESVNITIKEVNISMSSFSHNSVNPSSPSGTAIQTIKLKTVDYEARPKPQLHILIQKCNISDNSFNSDGKPPSILYPCAQVYVTEHPQVTIAECRIVNSKCSALMADHSAIIFNGDVELTNNTGIRGGAVYLADQSIFYLSPNTVVNITNNRAEYGGGIFIEQSSACFLEGLECFYQFTSGIQSNLSSLSTTHVTMQNNIANIAGNEIYGGSIRKCYFLSIFGIEFRKKPTQLFSKVFHYNHNPFSISSRPYGICFCFHNRKDCHATYVNTTIFSGQTLSIFAVTVGQEDGVTPGGVIATTESGVSLGPLQQFQYTNSCTEILYNIFSSKNSTLITLTSEAWCKNQNIFNKYINVTFKECPLGFTRNSSSLSCECIGEYFFSCDIDRGQITRNSPYWLGYDKDIFDSNIMVCYCPFDYCRRDSIHIDISTSSFHQNVQCAYNRSGVICGACQKGTSNVFGSSQCFVCSDNYLILIVAFAVAGVLLLFTLIALNFTVAQGTINGVLFYANIVQVMSSFFFPPSVIRPPVLYHFIAWFNLNIGIVTCFYNGLDTYSKTWLQWAFPLYLLAIAGVVVIIARRYTLLMRLVGRNATSVLATLILLSYTKLAQIVVSVFNISIIYQVTTKSTVKIVWTLDGHIVFFDRKHIGLVAISCLTLIATLCYIVILTCVQCLRRVNSRVLSWVPRLKPFTDTYTGVYKDRYAFWTGHLLLLRCFLYIIASFRSVASPITILSFVVGVCIHILIMSIWIFRGVYKKWSLDILESSFILNLCCLSAITAIFILKGNTERHQLPATCVSISIALGTFCFIMLYHLHVRLNQYFTKYQLFIQNCRRLLQPKDETELLLSVSRNSNSIN